MSNIINRYLLKQPIWPIILLYLGFSFLYIVADIMGRISIFIESAVSINTIVKYYIAQLLSLNDIILPASIFLGVLFSIWQMARHNEIIALRMLGKNIFQIAIPFLCFSGILSTVAGIVETVYAPKVRLWCYILKSNRFTNINKIEEQHFAYKNINGNRIWLGTLKSLQKPWRINNITIQYFNKEGYKEKEISAQHAMYVDSVWWLKEIKIEKFSKEGLPLEAPLILNNYHPFIELNESPDDFINQIFNLDYSGTVWLTKRLIEDKIPLRKKAITVLNKRFSWPFSCIVLAFFAIAVGLGISPRRSSARILYALLLFFSFEILNNIGIIFSLSERIPAWLGPWLPNIIFFSIALTLILKEI